MNHKPENIRRLKAIAAQQRITEDDKNFLGELRAAGWSAMDLRAAAAGKYRLMQARSLIRKVMVSGPEANEQYVSLAKDRMREGGGYRATSEVVNNKALLAELEETVKADIDAVLSRSEILRDLCQKVRKAAGIPPKNKKPHRAKRKAIAP